MNSTRNCTMIGTISGVIVSQYTSLLNTFIISAVIVATYAIADFIIFVKLQKNHDDSPPRTKLYP